MRPHVELIHEDDYIWHEAELPTSEGLAYQRNLSIDEEDGSSSLRIDVARDWGRPQGVPHADTEFFVLEGELEIGDRKLAKGGYVHVPKGVVMPYTAAKEGTRLLHYREYGDAGFDATDKPWADAKGEVTIHDTAAMEWNPVATPGPMPGMFIKLLNRDPDTGFYTRLIYAKEGWSDHRLAHHPCYEEAYTIDGHMTYNFGKLDEGTYFFRPKGVKHGHFVAEEGGCTWLIRSDGELINWYTTNEWIKWGGDAENYSEEQAPVVSTMPVRSRSRGPWSKDGM